MGNKSWEEVRGELINAWNIARNGYRAEPQKGLRGRIRPKYIPNTGDRDTSPGDTNQFSSIELRLRQVYDIYQKGLIDYEDFEREKARILSEI